MELRVDGKVALVTGADSGIGRGIALRLAEAGADVTPASGCNQNVTVTPALNDRP